MEGRTIQELFNEVINQRGISARIGISGPAIKAMRARLKGTKDNVPVSHERMSEVLRAAGYEVVQEELWGVPVSNS